MAIAFWTKFTAVFLFASTASAQSISVGGHTIVVKEGPEFELCARVLEAIEQVGEDAIGQCNVSEHGVSSSPSLAGAHYYYLRWALIRDALPPDIAVPDWQERYLSDPEWYAEAAFLTALTSLWYYESYASSVFTDAEIRQVVDQYLRDGTQPYDDDNDHGNEILPREDRRYYQAEFEFREYQQTISRFATERRTWQCEPEKEYQAHNPIFFVEPNTPEVGIVVNKSGSTFANGSRTDVLTYDGELYHMRNPTRGLVFERNLPYPETDPATGWGIIDACFIEILPNGF